MEINLLETTDAAYWAAEFERAKKRNNWTIEDIDEGLMIAWFANAFTAQEFKDVREKDERPRKANTP